MDKSLQKSEIKNNEEFHKTALKRFRIAEELTKEMRDLGNEDINFIAGDQWHEEIKNIRKQDGRPVITINRCPQLTRNVTNDQRLKSHPAACAGKAWLNMKNV